MRISESKPRRFNPKTSGCNIYLSCEPHCRRKLFTRQYYDGKLWFIIRESNKTKNHFSCPKTRIACIEKKKKKENIVRRTTPYYSCPRKYLFFIIFYEIILYNTGFVFRLLPTAAVDKSISISLVLFLFGRAPYDIGPKRRLHITTHYGKTHKMEIRRSANTVSRNNVCNPMSIDSLGSRQ